MQNEDSLVSIIVPAYNAAPFIEDTVKSIVQQSYQSWEVIIVNDGSTDSTAAIVESQRNQRMRLISQGNAGVSAARNKGLLQAKGEFVVFFDADDLMTPDFLMERVLALKSDPSIGFVGGAVESFPAEAKIKRAAAADPENEILFFNSSTVTIPSNYMFRKSVLVDNGIGFNQRLSSTADRFFILEVSKFARGKSLEGEHGKLLYRVTSQSMSNNLTPKLIMDNERFYYELKKKKLLPGKRKQEFKSFYFLSLAKGFGLVKIWKRVLKYLVMSFINHPLYFIRNVGKSIVAVIHVNKPEVSN